MPSWIVPSDTHVVGDTGHTTDHDHMADDLTLVNTLIPAVSGGLTGATSTFRIVGAIASGTAPASGTFSAGDVIIVLTGGLIVCTAGGSVGTWVSLTAGYALLGSANTFTAGPNVFTSIAQALVTKTASYTAAAGDSAILMNSASATTLTLPTAAGITGQCYLIVNISTGVVTLNTTSAQTINGAASGALTLQVQYQYIQVVSNGSNWVIVDSNVLAPVTGALAPAVVALTDAATIVVNAALGNDFRVTLTASGHTVGNPSNSTDGQIIEFQITQPASGGPDTVSWGANYDFGTDGAPTLTTTASKTDIVGFKYNATAGKWFCMGWKLGF